MVAALALVAAGCTQAPAPASPFPIATDRPSVSATPTLVPAGRLLVESGVAAGSAGDLSFVQAGELVLRRGLSPRLEVDVAVPTFREQHDALAAAGDRTRRGFSDPTLALRVGLLSPGDDASLRPATSLLAGTSLPTGGSWGFDKPEPSATLVAAWALPRGLALGANAGITAASGGDTQSRLTGILSGPLGAKGALFAELAYAGADGNWGSALVSVGATYLLNPRMQLDLVHRRQGPSGGYREFGLGFSMSR